MVTVKGNARDANAVGGFVRYAGQFAVASSAVTASSIKPIRNEFTVTRKGAGLFEVAFQQAYRSVVSSVAALVTTSTSGAVLSAAPYVAVISGTFCSSDGTNFTADTTQKKVLIQVLNSGTPTDPPSGFAVAFTVALSDSVLN